MPVTRPSSPAERCLRALWTDRIAFLTVVVAATAAAGFVTVMQPTLYASQALLSVKPPADVVAEALRTKRPYLGPDGHLYDANDPERQTGPGRYAPRLTAPGLVTLAAHDAGILPPAASLDDQQAARWVTAERIEGADLIRLVVWQPTADAAHKLAAAIVARGLAINQHDEANVAPPELRRIMMVIDPPTLPSAPAYPRLGVNLSVGFALGVLAASALVAIRQTTRG
ncbi:MAG TPA: hypothetical protein VKE51_40160 [Vicinamibacterales bacterium]|nr:hypothetical protein [Vicinamibacterales bacterium]